MGLRHCCLRCCFALRIGSAAMNPVKKLIALMADSLVTLYFFLEGEWLYFRRYLPELGNWLLFALCLAVLCFVLGFSAGVFWRIV